MGSNLLEVTSYAVAEQRLKSRPVRLLALLITDQTQGLKRPPKSGRKFDNTLYSSLNFSQKPKKAFWVSGL